MDPIHHYVIVYDCGTRQAAVQELPSYDEALARYAWLREAKDTIGRNEIEIILVGADDLLTLEKLHSVTFDGLSKRPEDVLASFELPA